jgi:hypothetical protein
MNGEPLPYLLRTDSMVVFIIFFCLILVVYILLNGKRFLLYKLKALFRNSERSGKYSDVTTDDAHYSFLLILHACILWGVSIYIFLMNIFSELTQSFSSYILLGLICCIVFLLLLKCLMLSFINWVFFDKVRNTIWIKTYYNIFVWSGLLLLPIVLLVVFGNLSLDFFSYWVISVAIFMKIVLFFKYFNNFFKNFHGCFHLILYLCTLEILPDILLWKTIWVTSHFLLQL